MGSREEMLEGENRALKAEVVELRGRCTALDGRFAELRRAVDEIGNHAGALENLFVASSRLHAATDLPETLRVVADILRDLVGARRYTVYMMDDRDQLVAILRDENDTGATAPPASRGGFASVDLKLGDRKVGLVTIHELLAQKQGLTGLDHELLGLVGQQAAPALLASRLLAERDQRTAVLRDFVKFLSSGKGLGVPESER